MNDERFALRKPFYGWIIVGVTFLIGATEAGAFQNILSIFLKPMAAEFGWSRAVISGAIALGSFGGGALSPFIGPVLDRRGPRMVAFWSVLILSVGLVAMSFASRVWHLYLFFGMGRLVAVGALSLVVSVTVSNWFIRRRGRAMGITWLGPRLGSAVLPIVVQFFIITQGWRLAWSALGVIVFVISGIPSLIFLRRRPEDIGLLPDGDDSAPAETGGGLAGKSATESIASEAEPVWTRAQALRTPAFWMLTFICSIAPFVQAGTNFHMFPFLTDQGIPQVSAILVLSTIAAFGAVGALIWGMLGERFKVKSLLAVNGIGSGLVFLLLFAAAEEDWSGASRTGPVFALAAFHGFFHGGRLPMLSIIWAEFYGRNALGSIYGLSTPFQSTANAVGPIFAALCFDIFGSYRLPFFLFVALFIVMGSTCLTLKPPRHP
jgi:MFS family permease